jgi:hypothetical protein
MGMATWFTIEFTGEPTEADFRRVSELAAEGYTSGQLINDDEDEEGSTTQVTITAGELLNRLVWDRACAMLGLNEWVITEGRMDRTDRVTLTLDQARELGLLAQDTTTAGDSTA